MQPTPLTEEDKQIISEFHERGASVISPLVLVGSQDAVMLVQFEEHVNRGKNCRRSRRNPS
jgi:hypothetical protein